MYRNYNLNILDAARFPPHHFTSIILFKNLTQLVSEHPLLNVTQKMSSNTLVAAPTAKQVIADFNTLSPLEKQASRVAI